MPNELVYGAACLLSYLAGAIPFGWLAARAIKGIDLRTAGSGNIGATNAARVLGLAWFPPIFALDFLKGFAPAAWLAPWVIERWPCPTCPAPGPVLMAFCGLSALAGHLFPVYLGFKGGKGVATGAGVVFALSPMAGAVGVGVWIVVFALSRFVSLASVAAAVSLPAAQLILSRGRTDGSIVHLALFVGIAGAVILKHRDNLKRLARGEEPKVGRAAGSPKP